MNNNMLEIKYYRIKKDNCGKDIYFWESQNCLIGIL